MRGFRPTLAQTFFASNLCLAALLGALLFGLLRGSEQSVLATSEQLRRATSVLIVERIQAYFEGAERLVDSLERQIQVGLCDPQDPLSVEKALFAAALDHPGLAGASFTAGRPLGWRADGGLLLAPTGRWQVSVYREGAEADGALHTSEVRAKGPGFAREVWRRKPGEGLGEKTLDPAAAPVDDPTEHLTFLTPASRPHYESGKTVWSDLSFLEADGQLPERERRVVVTALRALRDRSGRFAGVLRLGLRTETIDRIVREEQERARPNRIVLADEEGRLVSRLSPADGLAEEKDTSLRVVPARVPEEIARALRDPGLRRVSPDHLEEGARFEAGGRPFLATFRALPQSQGWRTLVVVAEDELPGWADQARRRRMILAFVLLVSAAILAGGALTLRTVKRGLGQIALSSGKLRNFDFAPARRGAFFRDMQEVLEGLELAKTAMRAMSKYVPVDLVRLLYRTGREPQLGGELMPVTLLFSDIKGFTTLSEKLPPNELAQILGRYLQVMTEALQGSGGTIDKYIGDAIMAAWNAPTPCPEHPRRACEAALAAVAAGEALYASREWAGRPPLVTRFGLHTDEVLVGHFGAPDRMSYTCLGDGVNLAARLEGLNKEYGTTILVSDAVRQAAGPGFAFRSLDVVAVSGKGQAVRVHELLGSAEVSGARQETARAYEAAFTRYLRRDFRAALVQFEALESDRPSVVMAERCRRLLSSPPPEDWDGTYVATSK